MTADTRAQAVRREAMRQQPHTYTRDPATGLCAVCAAGRVFWVHRPTQRAA